VSTGLQAPSVEALLSTWREQGVKNVRFEIADMHGTSRSKIIPMGAVSGYVRDGLNMYGGTVVLDTRSDVVPGSLYNEEIGYADQLLRPDLATAAIIPWADATARFICDPYWHDGEPVAAAPRHVFSRVLAMCRDLGYEPLIGIEYEFYLLDGETREPLFDGQHIFNTVRNSWAPVIEELIDHLGAFGIDIITANCEYAGSQWEINFAPGRGLLGPDQAFSFKNAVKEIARQAGYVATFMSKPFSGRAGSGAHTHITLLETSLHTNAFVGTDPVSGLSEVGKSFLAGQLAHARSVDALVAPTLNCLKRRRRHSFSPTNISWGVEDRSAMVRVKSGPSENRHLENRAPSAMSNPYLASAALLAAGVLGIQNNATLDGAGRAPAEEDLSHQRLPTSLEESLRALEADSEMASILGEEFVRCYLAVRRHELARFADHVTDWEREEYLELY
jgi:glutamine synthetase